MPVKSAPSGVGWTKSALNFARHRSLWKTLQSKTIKDRQGKGHLLQQKHRAHLGFPASLGEASFISSAVTQMPASSWLSESSSFPKWDILAFPLGLGLGVSLSSSVSSLSSSSCFALLRGGPFSAGLMAVDEPLLLSLSLSRPAKPLKKASLWMKSMSSLG